MFVSSCHHTCCSTKPPSVLSHSFYEWSSDFKVHVHSEVWISEFLVGCFSWNTCWGQNSNWERRRNLTCSSLYQQSKHSANFVISNSSASLYSHYIRHVHSSVHCMWVGVFIWVKYHKQGCYELLQLTASRASQTFGKGLFQLRCDIIPNFDFWLLRYMKYTNIEIKFENSNSLIHGYFSNTSQNLSSLSLMLHVCLGYLILFFCIVYSNSLLQSLLYILQLFNRYNYCQTSLTFLSFFLLVSILPCC